MVAPTSGEIMIGTRQKGRWVVPSFLLPLAFLLFGCTDEGPAGPSSPLPRPHDDRVYTIDESELAFTPRTGATAYYGLHEGVQGIAGYRIEVPDDWNGALIMYSHGYRGELLELSVSNPGIRSHLIRNGYAWAASSYSANSYDVRAGVEDTNALALAFEELTGRSRPTRYYITGHSMGGHISAAAVERETLATARNRLEYAGAVPMCGVLGDMEHMDYLVAYIVALRHLAGVPVSSFPMPDHRKQFPAVRAALWVDFDADPGALTPQGEKAKGILMNLSGGERPTFAEGFGVHQRRIQDLGGVDGTWFGVLPGNAVVTTQIDYQFDADPASSQEEGDFNAAIFRVEGDPEGVNPPRNDGVRALPILHGQFDVPVVTLHTLGDLFVPFVNEQIYARRAARRGSAGWLVQRAIRETGHCTFASSEEAAAFDDMVLWAEEGVVPAGDPVLLPEAIRDPMYGCAFTLITRSGIVPCGSDRPVDSTVLGHHEPEDEVDEEPGKGRRKEGEHDVPHPHPGGIPSEPSSDPSTHAGDDPVLP
jgi:hypothetical protein